MNVFLMPDTLASQWIDVVASRVTGHNRPRVTGLIATRGTLLNGGTVKRASRVVTAGAMLELVTEPHPTQVASRPRLVNGFEIIHEDRDIVMVDKLAGVAAHPSLGWGGSSATGHLTVASIAIVTSGAPGQQGVVS